MNRDRTLREACELVIRTMSLRPPQAEALRHVRDALLRLPKPLAQCSPEQRRDFLTLREDWRHAFHPTFTLALATGVGKTRLAGAIISLIWLAGEAKTFLVLAPRRAVLRRFNDALDPSFREYLFVDRNLVPEPSVVRQDEIDGPRMFEFDGDLVSQGPKIFLLSPQLITSSTRFSARFPFTGKSPAQALRDRSDLVVLVDEAHHVGRLSHRDTTAWAQAIRSLEPCLQIGLTATPRSEEGVHVLYEYPLRRALKEGLYTKDVHICVRTFDYEGITEDDVDHAAIDYALARLGRKTDATKKAARGIFPITKPVAVFFARDITHAEKMQDWIISTQRLGPEEVLLTHSEMSKSEEELERLLSIEDPDNPVRAVVNVMELTEGWDVTNVYVVCPLRAMATFQGALQAMGRGLRLPAGRRVGDPSLDELDVICFGKEKLEAIVSDAIDWSRPEDGRSPGVKVSQYDQADATLVPVDVDLNMSVRAEFAKFDIRRDELNLNVTPSALKDVTAALVTDVSLVAAQTRLGYGRSRFARSRFLRAATLRCIRQLPSYLSDEAHFEGVRNTIETWLETVRPDEEMIDFDPAEVGLQLATILRRNAALTNAQYERRKGKQTISFASYCGHEEVMLGPDIEPPQLSVADLPLAKRGNFVRRQLYTGWTHGVHEACSFDSEPEMLFALLIDRASEVEWWARNSPVAFEIDTPAGRYRPDFIVRLASEPDTSFHVVEVKADFRWEEPNSEARIKNRAARAWADAQREAGFDISVQVALENDIRRSDSWSSLQPRLR